MFTSGEFDEFAIGMAIKVLNSSPYYAQANGQAEASNKGIIKLIKRKIKENPKKWHTLLNAALWSYRMACHGSTKVSPISWCMDTMLCCHGRLKPDLGGYLFKTS